MLEGQGVYTYSDGSQMIAEYRGGVLNGEFVELDSSGEINVKGHHMDDKRSGFLQVFEENGSMLMGEVDESGHLSGDNIAYVYPDRHTALIGTFHEGALVKARYAYLKDPLPNPVTSLPNFELNSGISAPVVFDQSTHDILCRQPLVPDVYEQERVCVCESLIQDAGEGLYARRSLTEGEVVSFYNGVRLMHPEVDRRDWSLNSNTISLDDSIVLDVPAEYTSTSTYCASLGHKANHSNTPNCQYLPYSHPRFGDIKCISALRAIQAGEELTCDYGYTHKSVTTGIDDLPDWFVKEREGVQQESIERGKATH